MAELEREREQLQHEELDQKIYYDYERPFIRMKQDKDRMNLLPRVIKPALFAKGGHVLGDIRVFERYAVGPISSLTGSFLELEEGARSDLQRMVPEVVAYVLEGEGTVVQDGAEIPFTAGDVVVVPSYTAFELVADRGSDLRAWLPQSRIWHLMGMLWQEQLAFRSVPPGAEPLRDGSGDLTGVRVPRGTLGLEHDLDLPAGADPQRKAFFQARRAVGQAPVGSTRYDRFFLQGLARENELEQRTPRIVRGAEVPWEDTRNGKLKFYLSDWTEGIGRNMNVMALEIEPGGYSGRHRHIFEELLLVVSGRGYDDHEGTHHPWQAGDLICVPPMITHRHHAEGTEPALLISSWSRYLTNELLGGIEHLEDASSWVTRPR